MITEKDLLEGIAECHGQRNPNANTCLKLASFYTILDHLKQNDTEVAQKASFAYEGPQQKYDSSTEFGQVIQEIDNYEIMEIMDDLMSTLSIVEPRLYASVLRKLKGQQ